MQTTGDGFWRCCLPNFLVDDWRHSLGGILNDSRNGWVADGSRIVFF